MLWREPACQCWDAVLCTLVMPGSVLSPFSAKAGDGIPQRAMADSRTPSTDGWQRLPALVCDDGGGAC